MTRGARSRGTSPAYLGEARSKRTASPCTSPTSMFPGVRPTAYGGWVRTEPPRATRSSGRGSHQRASVTRRERCPTCSCFLRASPTPTSSRRAGRARPPPPSFELGSADLGTTVVRPVVRSRTKQPGYRQVLVARASTARLGDHARPRAGAHPGDHRFDPLGARAETGTRATEPAPSALSEPRCADVVRTTLRSLVRCVLRLYGSFAPNVWAEMRPLLTGAMTDAAVGCVATLQTEDRRCRRRGRPRDYADSRRRDLLVPRTETDASVTPMTR